MTYASTGLIGYQPTMFLSCVTESWSTIDPLTKKVILPLASSRNRELFSSRSSLSISSFRRKACKKQKTTIEMGIRMHGQHLDSWRSRYLAEMKVLLTVVHNMSSIIMIQICEKQYKREKWWINSRRWFCSGKIDRRRLKHSAQTICCLFTTG